MDINVLKRMINNRVAKTEIITTGLTAGVTTLADQMTLSTTYAAILATESSSKYHLDLAYGLNFAAETNYDIAQKHAVTVVGTITTAGDAKVVITANGLTGSPKTVKVPVALNDDAAAIAGKIGLVLVADPIVHEFFGITVDGANLVFEKMVAAASDATLNIVVDNDTSASITTATSAETVAGGIANKAIEFANVPAEPANAVTRVLFKLKCTLAPTTFTYPASVTWLNGTPLSPVTGNDYMVEFISYDNGVTWFASLLD